MLKGPLAGPTCAAPLCWPHCPVHMARVAGSQHRGTPSCLWQPLPSLGTSFCQGAPSFGSCLAVSVGKADPVPSLEVWDSHAILTKIFPLGLCVPLSLLQGELG